MTSLRIGLLGHGTVGRAFEDLLGARAGRVEQLTGRRPEIAGVLTRTAGRLRRDPGALGRSSSS